MKLLIITDAWHPQLNGVVRTLEETATVLERMGHEVRIVGPEKGWLSFPAPTYPEIRLEFFAGARLKKILTEFQPDYIHVSTEGPLGLAMRRICLQQNRPFSTAYHTCWPEYLERRVPKLFGPMVRLLTYQGIKWFHAPSGAVMVATTTIENLLRKRRIKRLRRWSRGVDTGLFHPGPENLPYHGLPRPILLYVGRVAVEKNLEAFLALDTPGSKTVIGDGPHEALFRQKYKSAHFFGRKFGEDLAAHFAAADLFVFPSKTDTFGLVLLEAVSCGVPVAAYPVQGPVDLFSDSAKTGAFAVLDEDLGVAVRKALILKPDKAACHAFVEENYSWEHCTRQFLENLQAPTPQALRRIRRLSMALDLIQAGLRRVRTLPKFYPNIYRTLSLLIDPFLPLYLAWRAKRGKEDPQRLQERFGRPSRPRPAGKLIWCHAASVGESLSLLPLLEQLAALPQKPALLLTTGTRSSAQVLARRLPETIVHQYVPVDTIPAIRRFFKAWKPDFVLITESELWPNMIGRIRKDRIPACLVNARISADSARRWQKLAALWIAALLGVFNKVLAQSDADAERLRTLGAYGAASVGNLKAAAPAPPVDEAALPSLQAALQGRIVWLMASTHEGEEEIALAAHEKLQALIPGLLTIILPRHPERAARIMELAARHKLSCARRSMDTPLDPTTQIYLADTLGEMGLFLRLAPVICVGGSFGKTGGHNPLEAAQLGRAVLFGPDMRNFREIADGMLLAGAAREVKNEAELSAALSDLLIQPANGRRLGEAAQLFAGRQQEVLERVMTALRPLLDEALG